MNELIRVAIVDDQQLFRQSLATLISLTPGLSLIGEAAGGEPFLEMLAALPELPHIALIDMNMDGLNGIALNDRLHALYPQIKVMVLSVHTHERLICKMIDAGASAYLAKNCDKEELLTAITTVHKSGFYVNSQSLKAIQQSESYRHQDIRNVNNIPIVLTPREQEILQLICRELTNGEIADALNLSVRTVEGHRNNLLLKTGCRNTAGLALFAVKYHIFEVEV